MNSQIEGRLISTRLIGIKTTYNITGGTDGKTTSITKNFNVSHSDACEVRVGLPVGIGPVKVRFKSALIMLILHYREQITSDTEQSFLSELNF